VPDKTPTVSSSARITLVSFRSSDIRVRNPSAFRCDRCCSDPERETRVLSWINLASFHDKAAEEFDLFADDFDPCAAMTAVAAAAEQATEDAKVFRAFEVAIARLSLLTQAIVAKASGLRRLTNDLVQTVGDWNRVRLRAHGPPPPTAIIRFDLQRQAPPALSFLVLERTGLAA
jgi:hypothetical protein